MKKHPKLPPRPKTSGYKKVHLTDMRRFHQSVNWLQWWEEFYSALRGNGLPLYTRIYDFARIKAKSKEQQAFLMWYLGPKEDHDPLAAKYPFITTGPLDWYEKRESGGWFNDKNLRALSKEITKQQNALEAVREAGNGIVINAMARVDRLMQQLDKAFSGKFFLPTWDLKDNLVRARAYISMHNQLLMMLAQSQDMYAKAHGINFQDMASFSQIVAASAAIADRVEGRTKTRIETALTQLTELALTKAARYQLPLPDEIEQKIVEIPTGHSKKKSTVN